MKRIRVRWDVEFDAVDDVQARLLALALRRQVPPVSTAGEHNVFGLVNADDRFTVHEVYEDRAPRPIRIPQEQE